MSDNDNHNSGANPGSGPCRPLPDRENGQGRLIRRAREVVYQTPEVRPEKVARLKEAIEQGTYEIDSRQLADILIKEWFLRR